MARRGQDLKFDACFNFRDLGGYETKDGVTVKSGSVFRSDSLHRLTDTDLDVMTALGVATVIDMRSTGDLQRQGRYPLADKIAYRHLPWYEDDTRPFQLSRSNEPEPDFARAYLDLVVGCSAAVVTAFEALAQDDHAIVFHCVAGKDRTGIIAALLLSVLGVPDTAIVADYQLTDAASRRMRAWAERHDPDLVAEMDSTPPWVLRVPATTMETFLQLVREEYGSVEQLVAHLGLGDQIIEELRSRLLESR